VTDHRTSVWIAANRLPVTWDRRSGWRRAPGGLVTALDSVVRSEHLGWIGAAPALGTSDHRPPRWEHGPVVAVPLDPDTASGAVGAICNGALWPALHGLDQWVDWRASHWGDYVDHNDAFARAIIDVTRPGDIVWVHDYHLLLVPRLLAEHAPGRPIVLSIHTPVDDVSVAGLPEASALVTGIAHADLVGVQTAADAQHLRRLLDRFPAARRAPQIRVSPVSIDPGVIQRRASGAACSAIRQRLTSAHHNRLLVVGIDRLDYTKGVPERLEALDLAFRRGWLDPDRVDYVGIAQPSRSTVPAYRRLRLHTERLAHELRTRWLRRDGTSPIDVRFEGVQPEYVAALLAAADVCAVTPLRDGMNLVAKEYSAVCKDDGVLLLSRGAGVFDEFGSWVIDVDGGDVTSVATGLRRAAELDTDTRQEWTAARRARLEVWPAAAWSADLLEQATGQFGPATPGVPQGHEPCDLDGDRKADRRH
jgi:trehalose-6-phosphate synthase